MEPNKGSEIETNYFPVLMRDGKWKGELKGKKKNGEQFDVHVALTLLKSSNGEPMGLLCTCRDITEARKIETALRESEERFRSLVESAPFCIHEIDLNGRIRSMNPAGQKMIGIKTEAEIIGRSYLDLVEKRDFERVKRYFSQASDGQFVEFDFQVTKNEKVKYYQKSFTPLRDDNHQVIKVVGIAEDVTERKHAEERLIHSENEHRLVTENVPALIAKFDRDCRYQFVNQHYSKRFGLTKDQMIGKHARDILGPQAYQCIKANMEKTLAGAQVTYEVKVPSKTKDLRWVKATYVPDRTQSSGPIDGFYALIEDIHDHKTANEKLQKSEKQYRSLIETAGSVIIGLTPDHRIVEWNREAERTYGWSRQEIFGKNYVRFFVPEKDQASVEADIKKVLAGSPTRNFENPIWTRDGQKLDFLWNCDRLLDEDQQPTGLIAVGRDITERKRAEEALKHAHQQLAQQKEHLARLNESFVQALGEITYDYNLVTDHIQWGGAFRRILGYTTEGMGNNFESWLSRIYPDEAQGVVEEFDQAINSKNIFDLEYRFKRRDGSYAWMHDRGVIHRNDAGQVEKVIGIMRDITDRKKSDAFLRQQRLILELIATGKPLTTILNELCLACEGQMSGLAASILLLEEDRLRVAGGPTLPEGYSQAIDGLLIGPAAGACGTAVYRKEPVIVTDIAADPLCEQIKEVPLRHGLKACWSVPIQGSDGKVLGTFAMYFGEPHSPTEQDLETFNVFIHLAGIAIEGKHAEDELRTANEELEVRVEERTAELTQSNTQLVEEIAERQRSQKQFVNIVKGVSGTTGERFFPSFVQQLTVALGVDYAFVGQLIKKPEPTVSTIAVYGDGTFLDNFEYGLNHTPCNHVATRREFCSFPKEAKQLFPQDRLLDDLGIEGYAGVPLKDSDGQVIGLIVVLKKEPLTKLNMVESTMKIFAARAAAELERKRSEEALHKSEALAREQLAELNMIYNSAPIGLCLVDKDLRYVRINETLSQMNGVPAADHIGKRFKDVLPDVGHHSNSIAKNIFQTGKPALDVEFQGTTPANPGEQRHWLANYYPIIDEGEVKAIGGVVQDITERKQREALLKTIHQAESEFIASEDPTKIFDRLLKNILTISNSDYGFIGEALRTDEGKPYLKTHSISNIAWDHETRELYTRSAPNLEFFNLDTLFGEVLRTGQPVIANDPPNDPRKGGLPKGHPPLQAFLGLPFYQGDRLVGMVGVANRPGGYDKQVIAFLQPLLTSCGLLLNAYQIEQRRCRTEQALQESEARLQAILDNSPGLIFLKDLNGRYLHVNRQFKNMLDLRDQEVVGKTDDEVFSTDQAAHFKTHDRQVIESQTLLEFEEVAMHTDGPHTSIVHKFPLFNEKNEMFAMGGITTDITIRKQAEKSLQESEERFRKIFEEGPLGMALVGLDYRFLKVNATLCRLVGYTEQELTTRTFADITHPEDLEKDLNLARQLFEGIIPSYTLEKRYLKKNGEKFWINLTASVIRDLDGVPLYGLAMIEDITDRKCIEQTLQHRMETIHDLYNNAPCGYHTLDAEGRYVEVNDTELKWLGYSREEMIGKLKVTDITTPASQRQFHDLHAEFKEQGHAFSLQAEYIKKDGTILNGLVSAMVVRDDQGQFLKSRTSVLDISALKEAEEALTESHLRFQRIFDEAGIGIVLVDITGDVVESNPAFQHFLGYSLDELKTMAFPEFIHPEDTPNCLEHYGKLVEGACQSYDLEERYIRKDGSVAWGHLTVTLLRNRQQEPLHAIAMVEDITERKRAEDDLNASRQAYQDLVNSLDGIVWECDFPSYQFTFVSKPAERLLGYPVDRWLSDHSFFPNHIHEDDREWALNYCQLSTLQKRDHELEYRMIHASGQIIWLRDLVTVIIEDGQPVKLRGVMVDITQRKAAEHALREAQSFTSSIIENIPNMVFVKDAKDLRFVRFNKAGESLLGYRREELLGKNDYDFFPREEADFFTTQDRKVLKDGVLIDIAEEPIHTREKGLRFLHTKKIPVYDEQGHPQYLLGISDDITERRQSEEALAKTQKAYEDLVNSVEGIVLECNFPSFQVTFVSQPAERILGYPVQEWLTDPEFIGKHLHPDDREWVFAFCHQKTLEKQNHELEYRMMASDGRVVWLRDLVTVVIEHDQPVKIRGVIVDITERKQAEEALKQSEERFRTLASHAPVGIFLTDKQGECQFVNEYLCKMLGLSVPDAQGFGWVRSLHPDDRERIVQEWKNSTHRKTFFSEEYRFQRPDGGVSWVSGTAVPRESEEGQILEYLGVCADITPLKHLENEIRKYAEGLEHEVLNRTARIQELEQRRMQVEKLAALAQVAAGVAHEINNPLASIAQSMTLFKRAISPRHHRYQYIGKIEECIERIARIVKQLYQLNRPEPPLFQSNDIIDTVRNGVEIMKDLSAKRGIKVISRLPSTPIAAKISHSDVIQVLCNLIQNALDVSEPDDKISISVVPRSDTVAIRVRDHGPGIPPEIAPHIFEPFFSTKSEANAGGMGLGLAISHNLIEAMGGTLDFKTSIGRGTTFTIKIPKI